MIAVVDQKPRTPEARVGCAPGLYVDRVMAFVNGASS
jgi:hypothetical protein